MTEHFLEYFLELTNGLGTTLLLMFSALILGAVLACLMTLGLVRKSIYLTTPIQTFIFFIRGTPLLVQIFLIYFGLGQFEWMRDSAAWLIFREPFACAVIALALNTSAYTTILFKGAIDAMPKGEVLACEALGMSRMLMLRRIIFPRALHLALPAYSNEVVMVLKSTSLASTITLLDLMGVTNQMIAATYQTLPLLCLVGMIYLLINTVLMSVFRYIESRVNCYL
jgi:arginine transport system permease protein